MTPQQRAEAQSLINAESWTDARALLERSRGEGEPDLEWVALRAEVALGEGELERAVELFERVLDTQPEHRAALYNYSLALSDLERHDEAMEALEELIELEGESASVLNDLAYEYVEAGHNVPGYLAAARAEALADHEGDRCLARLNAATALANVGRRGEATAWLDTMLNECTGACGERAAAQELRESLATRRPSGAGRSSAAG